MRDPRLRRQVTKTKNDGFFSVEGLDLSSEDDISSRKPRQKRLSVLRESGKSGRASRRGTTRDSLSSDSDMMTTKRRRRRKLVSEPTRRSGRGHAPVQSYDEDDDNDDEDDDDDDDDDNDDGSSSDILHSDLKFSKRKRGRPSKPERKPISTTSIGPTPTPMSPRRRPLRS
jgi:chromodomain-helicase-DNA-binding protein 4